MTNTYDRLVELLLKSDYGLYKQLAERIASELLERFDIEPLLVELYDGDIFQRNEGGDTIVWGDGAFYAIWPRFAKLHLGNCDTSWTRIYSRSILSTDGLQLTITFNGENERIR